MSSFLINPFTGGVGPSGGGSGLQLHLAAWKELGPGVGFNNNDPMATVTDWSGNARHFTQASSGARPLYQTGVLNSQPGIFFDGSNDFIERSAFMSGNAELFAVLKCFNSGTTDFWGFYKLDGGTLASHCTRLGQLYTAFGGTNRVTYSPGAGVVTAGFVHQVAMASGTNGFKLYENGNNLKDTATQTINWGGGVGPRYMFGASSDQTNGSNTTNWFKGHLLELLIYGSLRTTAERNAILADFNSRYGITVTNF